MELPVCKLFPRDNCIQDVYHYHLLRFSNPVAALPSNMNPVSMNLSSSGKWKQQLLIFIYVQSMWPCPSIEQIYCTYTHSQCELMQYPLLGIAPFFFAISFNFLSMRTVCKDECTYFIKIEYS